MNVKKLFPVITAITILTGTSYAETEINKNIMFYKDVAAALTGDELSSETLQLIKQGASSDSILDKIKSHEHFPLTVGAHWLEPLSILQGPDLRTLRLERDNGSKVTSRNVLGFATFSPNFRRSSRSLEQRNNDLRAIGTRITELGAKRLRVRYPQGLCNGERVAIYGYQFNAGTRRNFTQISNARTSGRTPGKIQSLDDSSLMLDISSTIADDVYNTIIKYENCGCNDSVPISFDSYKNQFRTRNVTQVRACSEILKPERCGPGLEKCWADNGEYVREVAEAMSLEPAAIIGKTIQDEAEFSNVLLSKKGAINWVLKNYLTNANKGSMLLNNTPGGYAGAAKVGDLPRDHKIFEWVEHGNNFGAGVTSTIAFQRATNGRRAKVNKLMQTFMCADFKVPEGTVFTEDKNPNPDLAKREYCSFCHRTLEPMKDLLGKWPELGTVQFEFDATNNSTGQFLGKEGDGDSDLGKIMTQSDQFKGCSVARAFEFLMGRSLSKREMRDEAPRFINKFEESQNLWQVMKVIIKYKAKIYYGINL